MTHFCCYFEHAFALTFVTTPTWNSQLIFVVFIDLELYRKIQRHTSTCLRDIVVYRILHFDLPWGFWTMTQEPGFFQTCFCKKSKKHWHFCTEVKNISKWIRIFAQTLKTLFWVILFNIWALQTKSMWTFFKNWDLLLFLLYDKKLYGKKIGKTDDPEIMHCRCMEKWGCVSMVVHSCETLGGIIGNTRPDASRYSRQ